MEVTVEGEQSPRKRNSHVQRHEGQIEFIQLFTDSHCMPCLAQEDIAGPYPLGPPSLVTRDSNESFHVTEIECTCEKIRTQTSNGISHL